MSQITTERHVAIPPDTHRGAGEHGSMRVTGLPRPVDTSTAERVVADAPQSYPCRRCLTDAEPGEVLLLVSYDPWTVASPYRQPGPVFVHERACDVAVLDALPDQQARRLLSLRAFDDTGRPTAAEVIAGAAAWQRMEELFGDGSTAFVHLHNAGPGCFAARVDR
jgi:hypothetical protein